MRGVQLPFWPSRYAQKKGGQTEPRKSNPANTKKGGRFVKRPAQPARSRGGGQFQMGGQLTKEERQRYSARPQKQVTALN